LLPKNPFIEPCPPTLAKEPPAGPAWVHEVKFDGYRLQLHKEGKDVVLLSKNATTSPAASRILEQRYHSSRQSL
jgi:ATP-dependent DNA ligase